jgi:hypothetical protein
MTINSTKSESIEIFMDLFYDLFDKFAKSKLNKEMVCLKLNTKQHS